MVGVHGRRGPGRVSAEAGHGFGAMCDHLLQRLNDPVVLQDLRQVVP